MSYTEPEYLPGQTRDLPTVVDHLQRFRTHGPNLHKYDDATFKPCGKSEHEDGLQTLRDVRNDICVMNSTIRSLIEALQSIAAADEDVPAKVLREYATSTLEVD